MKLASMKEIKVPVQVVLGGTELELGEVAGLQAGSVVGLKSLAGEPVDLVVAGETIAKGEVVVIDESFGIRLTRILAREE